MASPLPLRPSIDHTARDRAVHDLADDSTAAVFDAIGCQTARSILVAIGNEPATAAEIADRVDTSLQNVQYHLGNLEDADLVAAAGTWYSERGKEMTVYAPEMDRLEFRLDGSRVDDTGGTDTIVSATATAAGLND